MRIIGIKIYKPILILLVTFWASAQQVGDFVKEEAPTMPYTICSNDNCTEYSGKVVLDANWRWIHKISEYTNCYTGGWDARLCPDEITCARQCALEGVERAKYRDTYGVTSRDGVLSLQYVVNSNVGSRLYLTESDDVYLALHLLGKTLKIDVDVSQIPCGVNAALYLVGIDKNGGLGKGSNSAGSKYGTGYGDAQSPTDIKFVEGTANIHNDVGSAATEIDILEINRQALAWTLHPCSRTGKCYREECLKYCDKEGADMNPYRQGNVNFYGPGKTLDSNNLFTVATTFRNSSEGLVEVIQYYEQNGRRIKYPSSAVLNGSSTLNEESIRNQINAFSGNNGFTVHGGFKKLTAALEKGMVLVFSIWDDVATDMQWLDGIFPPGSTAPGARRGPCRPSKNLRQEKGRVKAFFSRIRIESENSTRS